MSFLERWFTKRGPPAPGVPERPANLDHLTAKADTIMSELDDIVKRLNDKMIAEGEPK
jgi:hypothetical protein